MEDDDRRPAPTEDTGSTSGGHVPSKEEADRLKPHPDRPGIPGEDPEDNPDEEGEDRFDAG
ncbi:hypothetical protein [Promicromonospora kroppenstedtii]|uniref:hypothetical protein n=1 Tax=Promicromonospora kroppenstedtii TaxID=440482 RepID=UPI0004B5B4D6|nr:hypothetical protein [Promicromonospora kroppenstedtii]